MEWPLLIPDCSVVTVQPKDMLRRSTLIIYYLRPEETREEVEQQQQKIDETQFNASFSIKYFIDQLIKEFIYRNYSQGCGNLYVPEIISRKDKFVSNEDGKEDKSSKR